MTKYPMVILSLCVTLGFYFKSNNVILSILTIIMVIYLFIDIKKTNNTWKKSVLVLISNIIQVLILIALLYLIFY